MPSYLSLSPLSPTRSISSQSNQRVLLRCHFICLPSLTPTGTLHIVRPILAISGLGRKKNDLFINFLISEVTIASGMFGCRRFKQYCPDSVVSIKGFCFPCFLSQVLYLQRQKRSLAALALNLPAEQSQGKQYLFPTNFRRSPALTLFGLTRVPYLSWTQALW